MWAEATQGMAGSAAAVGQRRADAGRAAAQARKMWHILRSRLRGDVSCCAVLCSNVACCAELCLTVVGAPPAAHASLPRA